MHRRRALAATASAGASLLAGCTGRLGGATTRRPDGPVDPTAVLELTAVTDRDIAQRATPDFRGTAARAIIVDAVENGSTTVTDDVANTPANRPPAVPTDEPIVYDDSVYRLSASVVDSDPVTVYVYTVDPPDGEVAARETVQYESLPAVDRQKLGLADPDVVGFQTSFQYTDEQRARSALVPTPDASVVVWGPDTKGRITIEGSFETEVRTYRYTASQTWASAAAYGANLREQYAFALSGLSAAERDLVETAIEAEDGYVVPGDEPVPDALERLADRVASQSSLTGTPDDESATGAYLARYDGDVYWLRLVVRT